MKDRFFIDSNIILYCYMDNSNNKSIIAEKLLVETDGIISSQVVGEVCNNLRKKCVYDADEVSQVIDGFYKEFNVVSIGYEEYKMSAELLKYYKFSFWDSLIIASALENNCSILYSEDMQHEQIIEDKLKIINPFK